MSVGSYYEIAPVSVGAIKWALNLKMEIMPDSKPRFVTFLL